MYSKWIELMAGLLFKFRVRGSSDDSFFNIKFLRRPSTKHDVSDPLVDVLCMVDWQASFPHCIACCLAGRCHCSLVA